MAVVGHVVGGLVQHARIMALFVLVLVGLGVSFQVAAAEGPTAPRAPSIPAAIVAIIDVQKIMQDSLAAQSVTKQLDAQRARYQAVIADEEKDLRLAEENLTKQKETLTPDVYADHEQQLRQRFLTVERRVQARRKALDQGFADSMGKVKQTFLDIVADVAQKRGVNLVVVRQQTLWSDPAMDITGEVLGRLNEALPSVTVTISEMPDDSIEGETLGRLSVGKASQPVGAIEGKR